MKLQKCERSSAAVLSASDIQNGFSSGAKLRRRRFQPLYPLAVAGTVLVVVFLIAAYFALILATVALGLLTVDFGMSIWPTLRPGRPMVVCVVLLVTALLAELQVVLLMLKPFLAKPVQVVSDHVVPEGSEPALEALVREVAERVGISPPARIILTGDVNASAQFGRGWRAVFGRELTLSLGMPLLATMSVTDLAGIIAHECGHFSQRVGTRANVFVSLVNQWFFRAVYEQDSWDARLESWSRRYPQLWLFLLLIKGTNRAVRGVLWALALGARGVSCFAMRRMEYDADLMETELCGSDAFAHTSMRLEEALAGYGMAIHQARGYWNERRLPKNFPFFVRSCVGKLDAETVQRIQRGIEEEKGYWHDTHPITRRRIEAARALKAQGVFRLDRPGSELFGEFSRVAEEVTFRFYDVDMNLDLEGIQMIDSDSFVAEDRQRDADDACLQRFTGGSVMAMGAAISLDPDLVPMPTVPTGELWRLYAEARVRQQRSGEAIAGVVKRRLTALDRLNQLRQAALLVRGGITVKPEAWQIPDARLETIERLAGKEQRHYEDACGQLSAAYESYREVFVYMVNLLSRADLCPQDSTGREAAFRQAWQLVGVLRGMRQASTAYAGSMELAETVNYLFSVLRGVGDDLAAEQFSLMEMQCTKLLREMKPYREGMEQAFGDEPYPFEHAEGVIRVRDFLTQNLEPDLSGDGNVFAELGLELERLLEVRGQLTHLYYRLLTRMAFYVDAVDSLAPVDLMVEEGDLQIAA